ncbi:MAG: Mu transposase C-terminal domain-containing protein [Solirubrobacteraceae bacterium]
MTGSEGRSDHRERQASIVARLVELSRARSLTAEHVRHAALALGVGERTVWRWVAVGRYEPPASRGYVLTPAARELFFATAGNVAAVHRHLAGDDPAVPTLRTLQRAILRDLSPAERAFARTGVEGARGCSVYLRRESAHRAETYAADHKELSIEVLAPRAQRPRRPWVTLFLDEFSRLIVGWAISLQPSQAEVLAALRKAVVVDPARGPFGGIPLMLRVDGGLEFAANSIIDAAATLGCLAHRCTAYQPWLKGKIERFNRTIEQTLLCELPRWTNGPRRADGQLADQSTPLTLERLVALFDAWVIAYNTERPHSALGGRTPLERWQADSRPVPALEAERSRWMLMPEVTRRVLKDGVHFAGLIYIAADLNGLVGETIGVRYMPHDRRRIELYRDGQWLATAKPQGTLSAEDRARVLERRRSDASAMAREAARARRRARALLAPITEPGPPEDITVIARGERDAGVRPLSSKRRGHLRLLGISGVDEPDEQAPAG